MRRSIGLPKKVIACALAALLGVSGVYVPDVAWAQEEQAIPEWAVDDGEAQDGFSVQATLPSKYDMRSDGLVTPVKFQNPWGSCWAFGGTAAAETSILSAYGSTYESSELDLSERHLTYFALQPVSKAVNPDQEGEGLHTLDTSLGDNAAYDAGGKPVFITTLFSQGIGPMLESQFPYRGANARTIMDDYNEAPTEETKKVVAKMFSIPLEQVDAYIQQQATDAGKTYPEVLNQFKANVKKSYEDYLTYSTNDDWFIPETRDDGTSNRLASNGMVLRNGNVLPKYWNDAKTDQVPNPTGIEAVKQEILNGHGVSIAFHAEQGTTFAKSPDGENKDQAQYVFDPNQGMNHGVCIVGWDDSYSAQNFHHEAKVTQADGSIIDRTEETTPPGDGAWIVKNSWGSETDAVADDRGNVVTKKNWGNLNDEGKHTGYFYLSYFDKTIQQTESMEFDGDLGAEESFGVLQHAYMPSSAGFYTTPATDGPNVTSSANVFGPEDGAIALKCVSARTPETNARVTFAIYELNDGATNPTEGKLLYRTSRNFEYGGFHRLNLDSPITIGKGKKFSVVTTTSTVDNGGVRHYSATANQGASEALSKAAAAVQGVEAKTYTTAVVNPGESFLYKDGSWQDWSNYTNALSARLDPDIVALLPGTEKYIDGLPIDNFSIKVYVVPTEEPQPEPQPEPTTFPDVADDAWYHDLVIRAADLGLFHGFEDGSFGPEQNISRGDIAVVLWNMAGSPEPGPDAKTFDDVVAEKYYAEAIAWASGAGIVSGYPGSTNFGPDDPIRREEFATMMASFAKLKGQDTAGSANDYKDMKDAASVSEWARSSVGWCFTKGIMSGQGENINPQGNATRAEAAKMIVILHDMFTA